jgi:type VI secretion system protein ImpK
VLARRAAGVHPLAGAMYWACSDLLTLASQLGLGAVAPPPAELRVRLDRLFGEMRSRAHAAGASPEDIADASYALAALLDELLVQSGQWPGRSEWQASPLQYAYFHENTAGDGFFRRAESLMQQPHRAHVLLVYFLCLALGFQGRYAVVGGAGLQPVFDAIGAVASQSLPKPRGLSPRGEPPDVGGTLLRREAPFVRAALAFLALALVVFVGLRAVLSFDVAGATRSMRESAGAPAEH